MLTKNGEDLIPAWYVQQCMCISWCRMQKAQIGEKNGGSIHLSMEGIYSLESAETSRNLCLFLAKSRTCLSVHCTGGCSLSQQKKEVHWFAVVWFVPVAWPQLICFFFGIPGTIFPSIMNAINTAQRRTMGNWGQQAYLMHPVFGLRKETKSLGDPHRHRENIQTRSAGPKPKTSCCEVTVPTTAPP